MLLEKFHHIKYQLLSYNIILFLITITVVLVANLEIQYFLNTYSEYSRRYEELNLFYESVSQMDAAAKSYLYSKLDSTKVYYEEKRYATEEMLNKLLEESGDSQMKKQYEKLGNMLDTHKEMFDRINNRETLGNLTMTETYEFFTGIADNISESYQQCSMLLADEMKERDLAMQETWKRQLLCTGGLLGLMVLGILFFSGAGIRNLIHPIGKIVRNIERIRDGENTLEPVKSKLKELLVLEQAVRNMAFEVRMNLAHLEERARLEKKLLEKENENLRVNELLIQTEIQVLQQQINPHFLFNTLSMISRMAYLEKAMKTSHLMEITADVLRYSLDKASGVSDLAGELECVRNYLEIQRLRYQDRISFQIKTEEGLPNPIMPGMVIQPFIENAVMHGVRNLTENARITVSVGKEGEHVVIRVEDNGAGMEGEEIQKLLSGKENTRKENQRKSIGVWNVYKRLEMFYGKKGIVRIESAPGCGTAVTLLIPYTKEGLEVEAFNY